MTKIQCENRKTGPYVRKRIAAKCKLALEAQAVALSDVKLSVFNPYHHARKPLVDIRVKIDNHRLDTKSGNARSQSALSIAFADHSSHNIRGENSDPDDLDITFYDDLAAFIGPATSRKQKKKIPSYGTTASRVRP